MVIEYMDSLDLDLGSGCCSMGATWLDYLESISQVSTSLPSYVYPVTDADTDQNVDKQDSGARSREQQLFTEWLRSPWRIALDFGCGTGANFKCFDQTTSPDALLIGLEPDTERAQQATRSPRQPQSVKTVVVRGDVRVLEDAPQGLTIDTILCSQVLGHVPRSELLRIVHGFSSVLRQGGRCAIAVPVAGPSFAGHPTSGSWAPGGDFFHIVQFKRSPSDSDYRELLNPGEFDRLAEQSLPDILPVRCFWCPDFPVSRELRLPIRMTRVPATLGCVLDPYFEIEDVFLYSVHEQASGQAVAGIGDALITLIRR